MSFLQHIEELRRRVLFCIFVFAGCFAISYFFAPKILHFLIFPVRKEGIILFSITPVEKFSSLLKLATLFGLGLCSPFLLHQAWAFLSPALKREERKVCILFFILCAPAFLAGLLFCFYCVLPLILPFLLGLLPQIPSQITLSSYISFLACLSFCFGLCFQMPILSLLLSKLGLIDHNFLIRKAKYALLLFLLLSAILTPPDILSQLLLSLPLALLYLLCILICYLVRR